MKYFNVLVQQNLKPGTEETFETAQLADASTKEEAITTAKGESSFKCRECERWEPYYIEAKNDEAAYDVMWGDETAGEKVHA